MPANKIYIVYVVDHRTVYSLGGIADLDASESMETGADTWDTSHIGFTGAGIIDGISGERVGLLPADE